MFRVLQGIEIWEEHGEWVQSEHPKFGPGIAERFATASLLHKDEHSEAFALRNKIKKFNFYITGRKYYHHSYDTW